MEPVAASRVVSMGFFFPWGSRDEEIHQHGWTHVLEHMLFKGLPGNSAAELARRFDAWGAELNGYTDKEEFGFHCQVPQEFAFEAADWILKLLYRDGFLLQDLKRELSVIRKEIAAVRDEPEEAHWEDFYSFLWPDQSLGKPIAGSPSTLRQVSPEGLVQFSHSRMAPSQLLLVLAGAVSPEPWIDWFDRQMNQLPSLQSSQPLVFPRRPLVPRPSQRQEKRTSHGQGQILWGQAWSGQDSDPDSLALVSLVVGELSSSRLFQNLREKQGLCYHIYSMTQDYDQGGCMAWFGATTARSLLSLEKAMSREWQRLKHEGITEEEWLLAKRHAAASWMIQQENMDFRMHRLAQGKLRGQVQREPQNQLEYLMSLDRQTALEKMHRTWFHQDPCISVWRPRS